MSSAHPATRQSVTLLELVDRVLDKGVVLSGDITLAVADVDLIRVELHALLASVDRLDRASDRRALPVRDR
ncbi:MAG: gas vesicle protein [Thermoleophilia bacterium]|nr:gas vesicle protein [Thermoleophilia bacterium]